MKIKVRNEELKSLVDSIGQYEKKCNVAFGVYAELKKVDLENKAKKNAKWIDRTGTARRSIKGRYQNAKNKFIISLEGYAEGDNGKDYFKYLELYHNKKNAILYPTIEENADEVVEGFIKVLEQIEL